MLVIIIISKQQKRKRLYEERVVEVRKKISITQAELERIKENRKITKKGKRNHAVLVKECKGVSAAKLVSFMEKQKAIFRKLKRKAGFLVVKRMKKLEALTSSSRPILAKSTQICARCLIRTKRMNDLDTQRLIRTHKRRKKCLTT